MKILRTILWVLAALGFLIFAFYNWNRVELKLWQNLVLETPLPALVLVVLALGFVPMWGVHRSVLWRQNRRIRALENSLKNTAYTRERDATPAAAPTVDSPVEKPGTASGEPADIFSPSDAGHDGSSGK